MFLMCEHDRRSPGTLQIVDAGRQRQHSIVEITQKNVRYPAVVVFFGVSDFLIFSKCLSYTDYYDLKKKKTL